MEWVGDGGGGGGECRKIRTLTTKMQPLLTATCKCSRSPSKMCWLSLKESTPWTACGPTPTSASTAARTCVT